MASSELKIILRRTIDYRRQYGQLQAVSDCIFFHSTQQCGVREIFPFEVCAALGLDYVISLVNRLRWRSYFVTVERWCMSRIYVRRVHLLFVLRYKLPATIGISAICPGAMLLCQQAVSCVGGNQRRFFLRTAVVRDTAVVQQTVVQYAYRQYMSTRACF